MTLAPAAKEVSLNSEGRTILRWQLDIPAQDQHTFGNVKQVGWDREATESRSREKPFLAQRWQWTTSTVMSLTLYCSENCKCQSVKKKSHNKTKQQQTKQQQNKTKQQQNKPYTKKKKPKPNPTNQQPPQTNRIISTSLPWKGPGSLSPPSLGCYLCSNTASQSRELSKILLFARF